MLVEQNSHRIFRLAFRMTGSEHDAEDVVQETFLRAYRNLGRFDSRAKVATWLNAIASNCAIDLLRKRKYRRTEKLDEQAPVGAPVSNRPAPDRVAMGSELRERVDAALLKLSARERIAFSLRHFEGQSIREVATAMKMPEGSVKNTIFRAVRKLRAALGPALGVPR